MILEGAMNPVTHFEQFGMSTAIASALKTGLLLEIAQRPAADRELAERLALDLRATSLVLDVLETVQLVRREGGQVVPGPALERSLHGPGGFQLALQMWGHTEGFLRTGEPFVLMDLSAAERERSYQDIVGGLGILFQEHARDLA